MGLVIFGLGTFAQTVARYMDAAFAFTVDSDYVSTLNWGTKPVVPFEELETVYSPDDVQVFVAVTQQNGHRDLLERKVCEVWKKGYETPAFVHKTATVLNGFPLPQNCLISPNAIVEPFTTLGNGVMVRSSAYIGHNCVVRDFAYIAPRASIAGHVDIGAGAFIGNNATIRDRVTIGHHAVIGCGAVVLRDVKPYEVYQGYPARLLSISGKDIEI